MTDWYSSGPIPLYFGVCLSKKAFKREMKRLNVKNPPSFNGPGGHATCHALEKSTGDRLAIITFDPGRVEGKSRAQIAALMAHEASHAADQALEAMRETEPGEETRAYLVQWFTQCALTSFDDHQKRRKKHGRK